MSELDPQVTPDESVYSCIDGHVAPTVSFFDETINGDTIAAPARDMPRPETLEVEMARHRPRPVNDTHGGCVFSELPDDGSRSLSRTMCRYYRSPQMQQIMALTGVIIVSDESGQVTDILLPDQERLLNATATHNVPIQLETDSNGCEGEIAEAVYSGIVSDRKHPVGINNFNAYVHDVSLDHLAAVIVCVDEIFTILGMLTNGKSLAHNYDQITSHLSLSLTRLFEGDPIKFNNCILGSVKDMDNAQYISQKLKQAIFAGIERLGIQHFLSDVYTAEQ